MRKTLNKNTLKRSSATIGALVRSKSSPTSSTCCSSAAGLFNTAKDVNFGNGLINHNNRGFSINIAELYNSQTKRRSASAEEAQKPNTVNLEHVHDVIKRQLNTSELDCIFKPKSICVIDDFNPEVHASPVPVPNDSISSTLARNVLWNLMSVSQVKVYAVSKHVERVI